MEETVVEQTPEQIAVESDAAFASGFDGERSTSPAKPKEVKAEEPAKEEAPVVVAPDPWAGVAPAIKAELESMSGKLKSVNDLDHRFKSFEGRLGKINTTLDALAAAKAAATTTADAPTQAQIESSAASSAKWKQLKEDFPDWVEAMDLRLAEMRAAIPKAPAPVNVEEIRTALRGEITTEFSPLLKEVEARARQMARVDSKYENWEETINTPEFAAWRAKQGPEVEALAASPKAADAIKLLDSYEETRKKTEAAAKARATNEQRLKGAMTPKGVPNASPATLNDEDAFEAGFNNAT